MPSKKYRWGKDLPVISSTAQTGKVSNDSHKTVIKLMSETPQNVELDDPTFDGNVGAFFSLRCGGFEHCTVMVYMSQPPGDPNDKLPVIGLALAPRRSVTSQRKSKVSVDKAMASRRGRKQVLRGKAHLERMP